MAILQFLLRLRILSTMKRMLLSLVLLFLICRAQDDCPVVARSELGSDAPSKNGLVADEISVGQANKPDIRIFDYNIVCYATGSSNDTYRMLSVVVTYECSGVICTAPTSPLGVEGNVTSQFEFTCSEGSWRYDVLGSSTAAAATFTNPSSATLDTEARSNCSYCLRPDVVTGGGIPTSVAVDDVTHCAGNIMLLAGAY